MQSKEWQEKEYAMNNSTCDHILLFECVLAIKHAPVLDLTCIGLFHLISIHPLWMTSEENFNPWT